MKRIVLLSNITNFVEVLFDVIVLVFRTHTDTINECVFKHIVVVLVLYGGIVVVRFL